MGHIVIACYRPKPGRLEELRALTKEHQPVLRAQGLVTDREAIVMEAKDGTILEVFEWRSEQAIGDAHSNPAVLELWDRYSKICDYVPVASIEEATELFSGFTPFPT